jgi:dTDP-4-dehydrorhamnose 3,5-epimerase
MSKKPEITKGNIAIDDRGELQFVNDFSFENIKRFYIIKNHKQNFIRAWHGHKYESKYCMAVTGTWLVAAVQIDDWVAPSNDLESINLYYQQINHQFFVSHQDTQMVL